MTKEFLEAIGAVTVQFARLDHCLEMGIWLLLVGPKLENQPLGKTVTADLSFKKRLDVLEALLKLRFPNRDNADFKELKKRLNKAEEERNQIVHSIWFSAGENDLMRVKTTARGELKTKFHQLSSSEVRAIATAIYQACEDLLNFYLVLQKGGFPS